MLASLPIKPESRAFLQRSPTMLIGADWSRASDGALMDLRNPATGDVLCQVPAATPADVDRAVRAARQAFDDSAWSRTRPRERQNLLWKLADLMERDADLLAELAQHRLVAVMISLTTLDDELKRILEPRAAAPSARLRAIRVMREHGIPVGVLCSPMIPMVNDRELEALLEAAHDAGAQSANYMMLRLPREVGPLFEEWLAAHYPQRASHVMSLIRQVRGGEIYDSRFGHRFRGEGPFAELLAKRFEVALRRLGLNRRGDFGLDCTAFAPPRSQMSLF